MESLQLTGFWKIEFFTDVKRYCKFNVNFKNLLRILKKKTPIKKANVKENILNKKIALIFSKNLAFLRKLFLKKFQIHAEGLDSLFHSEFLKKYSKFEKSFYYVGTSKCSIPNYINH